VVLANKNGDAAITQTNIFYIYQFTKCFGSDMPPSGDSWGNIQMLTDYTPHTTVLVTVKFSLYRPVEALRVARG
jgi:hypothetical protein